MLLYARNEYMHIVILLPALVFCLDELIHRFTRTIVRGKVLRIVAMHHNMRHYPLDRVEVFNLFSVRAISEHS